MNSAPCGRTSPWIPPSNCERRGALDLRDVFALRSILRRVPERGMAAQVAAMQRASRSSFVFDFVVAHRVDIKSLRAERETTLTHRLRNARG